MIAVESDISGDWDSRTSWPDLAAGAVRAAVAASRHRALLESGIRLEVSVKLTDDDEVRALNAAWRGRDRSTNVLSFPMVEAALLDILVAAEDGEALLGDIVLAHGICVREAGEKGIGTGDHAAHLVVHGALHLLGYDHETDERAADEMERVERAALASIGVANPYPAAESAK
jgi:probable rRNA maturation factor